MYPFGCMMDDEVGRGSVGGDNKDNVTPPSSSAGVRRGPGRPEPCVVDSCGQNRKKHNRFCHHHSRLFDNMRYQAAKKGKEQLKKFLMAMKDCAVASKELRKFGAETVAAPMFKSKPLINWVAQQHARDSCRQCPESSCNLCSMESMQCKCSL